MTSYEIRRFPHPGTIDADGHILEPPDLWENYLVCLFTSLSRQTVPRERRSVHGAA